MSIRRKTKPLVVLDRPGPEAYESTLSVQENLLTLKTQDQSVADTLVLVEHDHIYTSGRSSPFLVPTLDKAKNIPWVEIARGGQATYHGPGQLVAYPIFSLENSEKDVHKYLRKLEDVIVGTLSWFGLRGETREGLTGVWLKNSKDEWKKIASIGIGIRKWVSYHGISLNVDPDLDYFKAISPCGQEGSLVTSLKEILGEACPSMERVRELLVESFCTVFKLHVSDDESESQAIKRRGRPSWLRVKAPGSPDFLDTHKIVKEHKLVTVCEEARCPNMGECWAHGTATFMIMGDQCTRRCSFCSIKDGTVDSLSPLDPFEPLRVAQAVARLGLKHVVITSVNRDDIDDMGAGHFDKTIKAIKNLSPDCDVEFLIPDMRGRKELLEIILQSRYLKVLNHNTETIPRLYKTVRPGAIFRRSLDLLEWVKDIDSSVKTKSGLMVGLGETREEVFAVLKELREAKVDIITIGQYLQPTPEQLPVYRFVTPDEFQEYENYGKELGFSHIESGPLVRSSYHAWKHTGDLSEPRKLASMG